MKTTALLSALLKCQFEILCFGHKGPHCQKKKIVCYNKIIKNDLSAPVKTISVGTQRGFL